MVMIERCRQAEQGLQQPVEVGSRLEIPAARNVADALAGIVRDNRQVIAGRHVLAHDDGIAPAFRSRRDGLMGTMTIKRRIRDRRIPAHLPRGCQRAVQIEPQRKRLAGSLAIFDLPGRHMLVQMRIERRTVRIGRMVGNFRHGIGNLSPRRKAWIQQAHCFKTLGLGPIGIKVLRLPPHGCFPVEPQPSQVVADLIDKMRPRTPDIDVFNAQQEPPIESTRPMPGIHC